MYGRLLSQTHASPLLRLQASILLLVLFVDWMLMPLITKLEGTHLPVYMIGLFMLLGASDGLIQPLFKKVKVENVYLFSAVLDLVQAFCYQLYTVDEALFTYVMLSLFTVQGVVFEIARVHTVELMVEEVDTKEYLIFRSFYISLAVFLGTGFTTLFDLLGGPARALLTGATVLTLASVPLQLYLGHKLKKLRLRIGQTR